MKIEMEKLYFFRYNNPKYANVWDKAPLVIPLAFSSTHLLGINIHWIPAPMRLIFIKSIFTIKSKKTGQLVYKKLSAGIFKYAKVAIRKYIIKRITNWTPLSDDEVTMFLPSIGKRTQQKVLISPNRGRFKPRFAKR